MPTIKLTRRSIATLPQTTKPTVWYDTDLSGFGLRVMPSGARSWVLEYRPGAGGRSVAKKRVKIGGDELTPEAARDIAADMLASVRKGSDPAGVRKQERAAETVREITDRYLAEEVRPLRKASTADLYGTYFRVHVVPGLGTKKAASLTHADVAKWHRKVGVASPVTANRALMALSGALTWGMKVGAIPAGTNPCSGVERFREQGRERYLASEELARLSKALLEAEGPGIPWEPDPDKNVKHAPKEDNRRVKLGPFPPAAIRLLLLTGARLREVLHLRWEHVDFERGVLLLPDSKTGRKTILLNAPALSIFSGLPRFGDYVIAGNDPKKPRADLHRPWALISKRAGLEGVRLHDLRHTHASIGAGLALGLPIIGRLLGHSQSSTTERYAHLDNDPLRRASNAIASRIADAMNGN